MTKKQSIYAIFDVGLSRSILSHYNKLKYIHVWELTYSTS